MFSWKGVLSRNYKNIDEAVNARNLKIKEFEEQEKLKDLPPIKRNKNNIPIIEIFNRQKVKIAETEVDEDLYYDLIKYHWSFSHLYIAGWINKKKYYLARYITNCPEGKCVDHFDGDKLNNQRSNLRITTIHQNGQNKSSVKNSSSKYVGVSKDGNKWKATITYHNKPINLGTYTTELEAVKARDTKALELNEKYNACYKINL